jgi:hypothetical protein
LPDQVGVPISGLTLNCIDLPSTDGSAPNNCSQSEWLITTTPSFDGSLSSALILRPNSGETSSVLKKSSSTVAPFKDVLAPFSLKLFCANCVIAENEWFSRLMSGQSALCGMIAWGGICFIF